jgi:hypothetical protein
LNSVLPPREWTEVRQPLPIKLHCNTSNVLRRSAATN